MLLAITLVITIITTSLPIAYAESNTINALSNPDFEDGNNGWSITSGEITVSDGEGIDSTDALKVTDTENAVYQAVTNSDGSDFVQGSTFNWEFNFKSTTTDDIVALVLGTTEPTGNPDQFRQMMNWLYSNKKIHKKVPANGQYQVVVYSKPFLADGSFDNGKFGFLRADFSLTPTMYCTEKWTVILARTNTGNWTTISNPATTPFTLVKDSPSITYSLLSYSGDIFVDDVSFFIEKTGEVVTEYNNLQNGSFEEPVITSYYQQKNQSDIPYWNTTAYGGLIELFNNNNGNNTAHFKYGGADNRKVVDGVQAAELNADEASTLYQYIKTESESQYKWDLSHRGRHGADIMALVIGPKQSVDPGKPSKAGQDQFMQMVEWVKKEENLKEYGAEVEAKIKAIETKQSESERQSVDYRCEPVKVTVYSRPFSTNGGFTGGTDTNFSATESTVFSEKWDVTIICSGDYSWQTYGENDDDMYSYYDVPEGQTDSIFAFTAYKATNEKADEATNKQNTFGNLLDGIHFDLYYPASSVSFTGGDAVLNYVYKDELLTAELKSGEPAKSIMVDENSTFTLDVTPRYSTTTDENGNEIERVDAEGHKIQNTFLGAYITIGGVRKYYPATAINATD
ncbi:MAG: hypothetical protein ACI4Q8_04405, partial [Ruminococcus sp.]